jgi:hypothetical protein
VYFGARWGGDPKFMNNVKGGRFFATADYGYIPGEEYKLTAKAFGLTLDGALRTLGQDPLMKVAWECGGWLSDGGDCLCGVAFDQADVTSLVSRAVVYWDDMPPKAGEWGAGILDAKGNLKRIAVDKTAAIYPFDQTTIDFPPTTVNTFYLGFRGGKDKFVSVKRIDLHRAARETLDNNALVFQADAYWAGYDPEKPGSLVGLQLFNYASEGVGYGRDRCFLTDLAPFVEVDSNRVYASKGDYPLRSEKNERALTLRHDLRFVLPDGKTVMVKVTAVYGVELKGSVRLGYQAEGLPPGAKLGFELCGSPRLFGPYLASGATAVCMDIGSGRVFDTPVGPLGLDVEGTDKLRVFGGNPVRFELVASGNTLDVSLSLPIGPQAGIQPGMIGYTWYPSLADQGDEGIAPFNREDLELIETVDFSNTNDTHEVYDLSNDPVILHWKKSGEGNLPRAFGALKYVNEPEKVKVPLTKILNRNCRAINNLDTTYFRFNLKKARFEPCVPYLIVVEHAFDKERFGEFHAIALDPSGQEIVDNNLWSGPNPIGGCATGAGPYEGKFKKEPTFFFHNRRTEYGRNTMISLCFSTSINWSHSYTDSDRPDGPAVRSVSVYRVRRMPALPNVTPLLPEGARRHLTVGTESSGSPWELTQFPRLAGYNQLFANHQMPGQFLYGMSCNLSYPGGMSSWHANTLEAQRWLFQVAERNGVGVEILAQTLLACGFEGTDHRSFEAASGTSGGYLVPLSPTQAEMALLAQALDKSLAVVAKYKSFTDITIMSGPRYIFSKRNLDDFSRETGVPFQTSPIDLENLQRLLDSGKATVDAWSKWSSRKRFEYLDWLLKRARRYKPDVYLTLNQAWEANQFQVAYYSASTKYAAPYVYFDPAKLKALGIETYADFLKLICHDPALYSGDGFCFGLEQKRYHNHGEAWRWPSPYDEPGFEKIRDGFGGGLSVALPLYDESPKPLKGWTCAFIKDQRSFRRDLVQGLIKANARDFFIDTFWSWPFTGNLADMRTFAVAFQLLPFAKPEDYQGKITDTAKQAVIKRYGDRHGLMNVGDNPTEVTLTLPDGADSIADLSNGIRQPLLLSGRTVTIHLEPWSLKTLEFK